MTAAGDWLRRYHPAENATTRLICFPHAGGSASYFYGVSGSLSPRIDVVAVQYPGRQERRTEPFIDNIAELADRLTAELLPWIDRPVAFFGHSMGATLAFEVAVRLAQRDIVPLCLFASGRRAPTRYRHETVHLRDDLGIVAEAKRLSGTDAMLLDDEDALSMILPALRNDYKAAETYRYQPGPRLACPIVSLVGDSDPKTSLDEARAWQEHTSGRFELLAFPGGHFYLNEHKDEVITEISTHVEALVSAK